MRFRVGVGYDAHRLARGRPLLLGGVRVRHPRGLLGHSDADVVLHALTNALLGAAGLPDIGSLFSNRDPRWKGASSLVFLKEAAKRVRARGYAIVNVDLNLVAEAPKIAAYVPDMKANIARALGAPLSAVGIQASTNEGMGFVGRRQGMACHAVALIRGR